MDPIIEDNLPGVKRSDEIELTIKSGVRSLKSRFFKIGG